MSRILSGTETHEFVEGYGLTIQKAASAEQAPPSSCPGSCTPPQKNMYPHTRRERQISGELLYVRDERAIIDGIAGGLSGATHRVPSAECRDEGQKKKVARIASISYAYPECEDANFLVFLEGDTEPVWLLYSKLQQYPHGTEAAKGFGSSWNIPE